MPKAKKNIVEQEIDNLQVAINKIKSENNKFNILIWGMLALFVITFISQLNHTALLMFLVAIIIVVFLNLKTNYQKTKKELEDLKTKLRN